MMYTFKLQTVLDHRQHLEDHLKITLAEIKQQRLAAQQRLETLKSKEMNTITELNQQQGAGLSSDQVLAYHAYLKRLSDRITAQSTRVDQTRTQESDTQAELLEAVKKRQILEKLKDQGLIRYNQMMLKKEMDFIDEIAVNQYVRNSISQEGGGE